MTLPTSEASPLVAALLRELPAEEAPLDLAIDPADEMLGFLTSVYHGDEEQARCAYLLSGRSIAVAMEQVLRWRFGDLSRVGRVLDFASGYGRVTRFLVRKVAPRRLWVSDIYAEAVAFQQRSFGVHGFVSTLRPQDLAIGEKFDAILVTSLFTHLPAERFIEWLRVLLGLLTPQGVLAFSVHGEDVLPLGQRPLPASGILFQEISESGSLPTGDYGSTWVSEAFVRTAAERAAGKPVHLERLRLGICNYQDLYIAVPDASARAPLEFQYEPYLACDLCALEGSDRLSVAGWAGTVANARPRTVHVAFDGQPCGSLPVDCERGDVAEALGNARFARSGWGGTVTLPFPRSHRAPLTLTVEDEGGERWLASFATLDGAMAEVSRQREGYLTRCLELERRQRAEAVGHLEQRIAAMEASRFWKLRNRWFALKRWLRLTGEA